MGRGKGLLARAPLSRVPRLTVRLRLTMLYGCMFAVAGAALLAFNYLLFERATAGKSLFPAPGQGNNSTCHIADSSCIAQVRIARAQGAIRAHQLDLHTLLVQSGLALAAMVALAFVLGWLMAGRALRPVRVITASARRISAASMHERLAVDGPDDEFKELTDTLNDLLARLEAAFTAQRHFVANASHELRTPLTLDRTLLQMALRSTTATTEQWRATGQELLESGLHQERILEALLTLASSEAGLDRRERVDLSEVAQARLNAAGPRIAACGLRLRAAIEDASLCGDPDLIERLTANLVNNAVQHNLPDGIIEVSTGIRNGQAVLSVANTGLVIPPTEIDRLYRPFQRLADRRTIDGGGHGLGLSIVAAIAIAHQATLTTQARPQGGLQIQVSFPADSLPSLARGRYSRRSRHKVAPCSTAAEQCLNPIPGRRKMPFPETPGIPQAPCPARKLAFSPSCPGCV
jgi:signal transduction histidine kinase